MKSSQPLATRQKKKFIKKYLWVGGVYTMENKGTKTDYKEFVRVGDEKWENVEITIRIIFILFEILIHYFLYREIWGSTRKKSLSPKVPIPTQNPYLT